MRKASNIFQKWSRSQAIILTAKRASKGQPTQNGARRRGTTIPSAQPLEEECKKITLIIPANVIPELHHLHSSSEAVQMIPVRKKAGILKPTNSASKEKTEKVVPWQV